MVGLSDVNVVLPMSYTPNITGKVYHKNRSHARFDCQIAPNLMSAGASFAWGTSQRSPDYLSGYEWHGRGKERGN